jgi:hypothetical protein
MQISLLGEIAQDHSVAIKTLFNFIKNYEINFNVYFAIKSLTKMDKTNPDLVLYIILILRDSHKWHDTYMFYGEIYEDLENCGWVKICQDNLSYFISNLDQLAKGFVDDSNCCFTADFLMSVDKENKSIQNILAVIKDKLIESADERVKSIGQHKNDIVLTHIAEVLERIEPGCCLGIELLLKLKEIKGLDSNIVYSLSEVAKINSLATQLLKNFYTEQCDKETKQQIEDALIEIDDHIYNLRINKVLRKFSKCERNIYMHLADALNRSQTKLSSFELREIETIAKRFIALSQKINRRNNIVFSDFSRLFKDYHDHFSFIHKDMEIFRITITIVINHLLNNHWKVILNSVNLHLEKTVNSREEFEDFEQCFEVAWLISQRVDYLEFYEVWNRSSISYQL